MWLPGCGGVMTKVGSFEAFNGFPGTNWYHQKASVVVWSYFVKPARRMYFHFNDVRMGAIASQNTSFTVVYSTVQSGADQRKHQSSAPLAFVRGIHRWPVNSLHKWLVTPKMFPFDDVTMLQQIEFHIQRTPFQCLLHIFVKNTIFIDLH